jgi:hypothetical protein
LNTDATDGGSISVASAYQTSSVLDLFIPLSLLLNDLDSLPGELDGNEVQVAPHEYAVAGALFLLFGAIVEGSIQRARLEIPELLGSKKPAIEYLRPLLTQSQVDSAEQLIEHVEEVVAVRNAIAHNHIWRGEIDPESMRWIDGPRLLVDEFGDKRHTRVTSGSLVTKLLGLNVLPSKVGRTDVAIAMTILSELWTALATCPNSSYFSNFDYHLYVGFRGGYPRFGELVRVLAADWRPVSSKSREP